MMAQRTHHVVLYAQIKGIPVGFHPIALRQLYGIFCRQSFT